MNDIVYKVYKEGYIQEYELLGECETISHNRSSEGYKTEFYILGFKGISDTLVNVPIIICKNELISEKHYQCYLSGYIFTKDKEIANGYIDYSKKEKIKHLENELEKLKRYLRK